MNSNPERKKAAMPEAAKRDDPRRRIFIVEDHPMTRRELNGLINNESDLMVCGEAESDGLPR